VINKFSTGKVRPSTNFLARIFRFILISHFHVFGLTVVTLKPFSSQSSEPEFQTPDIGVLVHLLHTIGFDLHRIENLPDGSPAQTSGQEPLAAYSVTITCAQSGLHAVLRSRSDTEAAAVSNSDSAIKQVRVCGLNALKLTKMFKRIGTTTYLLTELSPSWEAINCAAPQELPSILWNPKVQYRVHKSPPLVPILSHIHPILSL
jgi:hypothetical protein